jgi:hypothetical protein
MVKANFFLLNLNQNIANKYFLDHLMGQNIIDIYC